ncbi:glycerol-3-phosphate O-acyltransferase / dihydroxyacetone phosphate acyltransferase [Diplonema papillatum]|nr:glycerol-3-phosphate O-acyltransferase / dihydroxyacetone phosphate acyltransferase [Diplonema papillatum]
MADAGTQPAGGASDGWLSNLKHMVLRYYFSILVWTFYREVDIIGEENVPTDGAVIFCGNHQNQFVDALMLFTAAPRRVGFIIAAKSLQKAVIGTVARLLDAIPVRRPQDESKKGTGDIVRIAGDKVFGENTCFTEQVCVNDLLSVTPEGERKSFQVKVVEVVSDAILIVKNRDDVYFAGVGSFKTFPKIDHNVAFESVYSTLRSGECIGIFPEGGSHDRTDLLPMKDGIARFALGAQAHGIDVTIIPVGLTYYYGHRFRSRAHVEFGTPIKLAADIMHLHNQKPEEATAAVMTVVESGLRSVTINAPDWQTLKYVHHMRRLYQPGSVKLPVRDLLRTTRLFASSFQKMQRETPLDPAFVSFTEKLELYQNLLKEYLVTDAQVESLDSLQTHLSYSLLLRRMLQTGRSFILSIPGVVLALPIGVTARIYSLIKAQQDCAASSVKLRGNDVKASYKIVCAMIFTPILLVVYAIIVSSMYGLNFGWLVFVIVPMLCYISIGSAYNVMTDARSAFPLLLSLHSKKYYTRFTELWHLRNALVQHVTLIVEKKIRHTEGWDETAELTHQRILLDRLQPQLWAQSEPFTVVHTSRLSNVRKNRNSYHSD